MDNSELVQILIGGGVGILRTDTLYGLVCRADDERAVQRVYDLKGRDDDKSPIVLIANKSQLFDEANEKANELLTFVWPGKVSVILDAANAPRWVTRGNKSVAYRLPSDSNLKKLIEQTGPLIAPSANPQGSPPAMTIEEAKTYFGNSVDFYGDGGMVTDATPSQLLRISPDGEVERLR